MFLSGILRPSVWMNMKRASDKQVPGDLKGEGRLLGGMFIPCTVQVVYSSRANSTFEYIFGYSK